MNRKEFVRSNYFTTATQQKLFAKIVFDRGFFLAIIAFVFLHVAEKGRLNSFYKKNVFLE